MAYSGIIKERSQGLYEAMAAADDYTSYHAIGILRFICMLSSKMREQQILLTRPQSWFFPVQRIPDPASWANSSTIVEIWFFKTGILHAFFIPGLCFTGVSLPCGMQYFTSCCSDFPGLLGQICGFNFMRSNGTLYF